VSWRGNRAPAGCWLATTTYQLTFKSAGKLDVVLVGNGARGTIRSVEVRHVAEYDVKHAWGDNQRVNVGLGVVIG
jgi:hypothetical protein